MKQKRFYDKIQNIEILIQKEVPSSDEIQEIKEYIEDKALNNFLFENLMHHEWIIPLRNEGLFKNPPGIEKEEEKGVAEIPIWPELRYLVRMASKEPETVADIALSIPKTENTRVYEDIIDIALAIPSNLSIKFVPKAKKWIKMPYQLILSEKLGKLVEKLAKDNEEDAAFDLAKSLLEIVPGPDDKIGKLKVKGEPQPRFHLWDYERILSENVPALFDANWKGAIKLFSDLLKIAMKLEQIEDGHTCLWRSAIEDSNQNHATAGIGDLLIVTIRDNVSRLATNNVAEGPSYLDFLLEQEHSIFKRIELYLIFIHQRNYPERIEPRLTDDKMFDVLEFSHEYYNLMQSYFGKISPEGQSKILDWITNGPNIERYVKRTESITGSSPAEKDIKRYIRLWQYKKYYPIQSKLEGELRDKFDAFENEFGKLKHPDYEAGYIESGWVGPTSPLPDEELMEKTAEEIINYFKTWVPEPGFMKETPEGLARQFSTVIEENPEKFVAVAAQLIDDVDCTYVSHFFSGLREAFKKKHFFAWEPVLALANWVVEQPRSEGSKFPEIAKDHNADLNWIWTRQVIADLLPNGFSEVKGEIPYKFRSMVKDILLPLTDDEDPTQEHEDTYGGDNMEPSTMSINTVRGKAMHAIIQYALWVSRHEDSKSFDNMPEVKDVLEKHLDIDQEPSLTIRSVYGQWLPWLLNLDESWVKSKIEEIFPEDDAEHQHWVAAWDTYIRFCRAYDPVFDVLSQKYHKAVKELPETDKKQGRQRGRYSHLAQHLMIFYIRGKIELEDEILGEFWAKANDDLRGDAISFVGRSFAAEKNDIPDKMIKRSCNLFETRLGEATNVLPGEREPYIKEISNFGWWFTSGKFDDKWLFQQLHVALDITDGRVEPSRMVVEHLVKLAPDYPLEAITCLNKIALGKQDRWEIHSYIWEAQQIVEIALESDNEEARKRADELRNRLGERGFIKEFR